MKDTRMRYTLSVAATLALFWVANSGHFTLLLLCFGGLSVLMVTWISHRMDVVDNESQPLQLIKRIPRYLLWLSWKIVLSNLDLVRRIWRPGSNIDPVLARIPTRLQTDMCRVIYANSINLTPGTLTIEDGEGALLVHALYGDALRELEHGEMENRVLLLEDNCSP